MRGAPKKRPGSEKAQKTLVPPPLSPLPRLFPFVAEGPLEKFTKIKRVIAFLG